MPHRERRRITRAGRSVESERGRRGQHPGGAGRVTGDVQIEVSRAGPAGDQPAEPHRVGDDAYRHWVGLGVAGASAERDVPPVDQPAAASAARATPLSPVGAAGQRRR
jgi:hypothetical protein